MKKEVKKIRVAELFAGVGGFRLGLEGFNGKSATSGYQKVLKTNFQVVWSNQWEPSTKQQHASMVYECRFGNSNHSNVDIAEVPVETIPNHDLLCGGFPCQDYSVATTLRNSKGLIGKKGVLWWSIHRILSEKIEKPKYLLFENVDRLLKSPSNQRGRDFAVILQSLNELGYAVEWRVINSAEYGFPQRRKRVFFLGYLAGTREYEILKNGGQYDFLDSNGTLAKALPVVPINKSAIHDFTLIGSLSDITVGFNKEKKASPFLNSGVMIDSNVSTVDLESDYSGPWQTLGDVLINDKEVSDDFWISKEELPKWEYLKGSKSIERTSRDGHCYIFTEGKMSFPDSLEKPSRTIITGEGGKAPSRFKHVIETAGGLRRLTPIELERLCGFPDNHTNVKGIQDAKRGFFMGNALVVGIIERIANQLSSDE